MKKQFFLIIFGLICTYHVSAATIDSSHQYAYSENAGWLNFAATGSNVVVLQDHLEGYVWGENIGWIRLGTSTAGGTQTYSNNSATTYGVNRNSSTGVLSGYAWGENIGWIKFDATGGNATLSNAGDFTGAVWAENIGWIKLTGTAQNSSTYQLKSTSLDTAPVASSVSFSGTLQTGITLTGVYTYADVDGDSESGTTFTWFRSDNSSGGGSKAVISDATSSTYVLSSSDVGKFISFAVTPQNAKATGTAVESTINSTAVIAADSTPTASSVSFSGTVQVGETLTGVYTYADAESDAQSGTTFRWLSSDNASGNIKNPISGATHQTYVLSNADVGKFISFEVTPKNANDTGLVVESSINSTAVAVSSNTNSAAISTNNNDQYAYGENIGWLNFAATNGNVRILPDHLEGYVWGENIGWIRLGTHSAGGTHTYANDAAATYGVNRNSSTGVLSGYAWGENIGWIKFDATGGSATLSSAGDFTGAVWAENIGWIKLNGTAQNNSSYQLKSGSLNSAPVFTSPANVSILEGNTAVLTVTASDESSLSFSLNGGADVALFTLTTAGVLSFNTAPSFANPSDTGSDNTYNLTLYVSDGTYNTAQAISIIVINGGNVSNDIDADNNGITDKLEQNYGTDDADSDGIPDTLEDLIKDLIGDSSADINASTDSDGDGMPDVAEVMLGRDPKTDDNSSANAPTITVTNPTLALRANATLSPYSLSDLGLSASDSLTPVAYYKNGACTSAVPYNYKTVCNTVPVTGYPSGTQNLWWLVTDSTGNWGRAAQVLKILPSVSFFKDLTLAGSANNTLAITLALSGALVDSNTTLTIPYTVTGTAVNSAEHDLEAGNFVFQADKLESDPITITLGSSPVNNNTIIVNLTTTDAVFAPTSGDISPDTQRVSVSAGSKTSQTITLSTQSFPPRLANLKGTQGEVIGRRFDKTQGTVTLSFKLNDPDSGTYTYSWENSHNSLVLNGGGSLNASTSASPTLDISGLTAGRYYLEVQVTDTTAPLDKHNPAKLRRMLAIIASTTLDANKDSDNDGISDAVEGLGDSDGDGRPDYLDAFDNQANIAPTHSEKPQSYLMKASAGLKILIGTTANTNSTGSTKITQSDLATAGNEQGESVSNAALTGGTLNHIFDYEIEDIEIPSDTTAAGNRIVLVLPLSSALVSNSEFKKYDSYDDSASGWKTFTEDANNSIQWANWLDGVEGNCPDIDSLDYSSSSTAKAGTTCIKLTLQDGGVNDADGVVDGRIVDPFAVSTPDPVVTVVTVVTTGGGGGSTYVPPVDPCANISSITGSAPTEGECDFTNYFVLTLEPAIDIDASVDFTTRDGSAKAGEDYVATSGTITIPAGETQALIPVKILGR